MSKPARKPLNLNDAPARPEPAVPQSEPDQPARHSTRVGKRGVQLWLSPEAHRQLRMLAAREDRQIQDLLAEGLDLVFTKYGEHRIASK